MQPGLRDDQKEAGRQWLRDDIRAAYEYVTGQRTVAGSTTQETETAKAQEESRVSFKAVKKIVDDAKLQHPDNEQERNAYIARSLEAEEEKGVKALETGVPNKSFGEIFFSGLSNLNPIALIGGAIAAKVSGGGGIFSNLMSSLKAAIIGSIKDAAIAYGGDAVAPWLKSVKNNYLDGTAAKLGRKVTTEDAARELAAENASRALAKAFGVSEEDAAFKQSVIQGIENRRLNPEAPSGTKPVAPGSGATEKVATDAAHDIAFNTFNGDLPPAPGGTPAKPGGRGTAASPPPAS